jgi:hypothetical protein
MRKGLVLTICISLSWTLSAPGAVWYVDRNNQGGKAGVSWGTAFNTIQEAVDAASKAGSGDVWVRAAVYDEERGLDPDGALIMRKNVHLYGGFAGREGNRNERNWKSNETTIDGSRAREGAPAYHVIAGSNNATLDGFVVTGGDAYDAGPATDSPKRYGGGMYNSGSSPSVVNCTFTNNRACTDGAGMYNCNASCPSIRNCTFESNTGDERGGGIGNRASSPIISACMFLDNHAYSGGAGIHNDAGASPRIVNCIFARNSGYGGGSGILNEFDSNPLVVNCVFAENSSINSGGAIANVDSSPTVINCILWGNAPDEIQSSGGHPVVTYSDVQSGYPGEGNMDPDPQFLSGGFSLSPESPCIDAGTAYRAPNNDIRGVSRPQGNGWDMGAYESTDPDSGPPMPLNIWILPIIFLSLAAVALPRGEQKAEISLEPNKPTGIAPPDL